MNAMKNAAIYALGVYLTVVGSSVHAGESRISQLLSQQVAEKKVAGVVTLIESKDKVLSLEAVGFADVSQGTPMKEDTIFWIASMSKPIVATALMMLVEEGKVRLDDPIDKYMPRFRPKKMVLAEDGLHVRLAPTEHRITVRNLLSHVSGIRTESAFEVPTLDLQTLSAKVDSYAIEPLLFEPGTNYAYSDAGINTASRVIELVSGESYGQFLEQRIFEPLGMTDTTLWPSQEQSKRIAKSYLRRGGSAPNLTEMPIGELYYPLSDRARRHPPAAGGVFSTARDLGKFCQMLLNGGELAGRRYISEDSIREMTRNQLTPEAQESFTQMISQSSSSKHPIGYGLGWLIFPSGTFGHSGAYSTNMQIDPKNGIATIWLVQMVYGQEATGSESRNNFQNLAESVYRDRSAHAAEDEGPLN